MVFSLLQEEIERLLKDAGQAPSGGNLQPWLVNVTKNTFQISLHPKRAGSFLDVHDYASILGLGCFVENLSLSADKQGLKYEINLIDTKVPEEFRVEITFIGRGIVNTKYPNLYNNIEKRSTNRQISDGTILSHDNLRALEQLVSESDSQFKIKYVFDREKKVLLSEILGKADGIRMSKQYVLKEMLNEFRWNDEEVVNTRDGIDLKTLELPGNLNKIFSLLREFPFLTKIIPRKALEETAKPLMINSSHLVCISTNLALTPTVMFNGGRIVERVWLAATDMNLAFQPWTTLLCFLIRLECYEGEGFTREESTLISQSVEAFRSLFELNKTETPIFFFRLSKANDPTKRSLKLNWEDYTTFD